MNRFEYWKENPGALVQSIMARLCKNMGDEKYLKIAYRLSMGKKLDLENPTLLSEKLQWLKLYNRDPFYTKCVDKYEAKKVVAERLGTKENIVPLLGVWDKFENKYFLLVSANRWEKNNLRAIEALDHLFSYGYLEGFRVRITGASSGKIFKYKIKNPE